MVAFVGSVVVTVALMLPIAYYARRRAPDAELTWGEAMVGATYIFFLLFWIYGVVPHQWLQWADSELNWRPDRTVAGPGNIVADALPFTVTYETLRDLIVSIIYVIGLVGMVVVWLMWQSRGEAAPKAIDRSPYGRPLVRKD